MVKTFSNDVIILLQCLHINDSENK